VHRKLKVATAEGGVPPEAGKAKGELVSVAVQAPAVAPELVAEKSASTSAEASADRPEAAPAA
ncbi:MAG: alginate biosynthesis protein AlgP, partial [Patescibacteria group bacterium]